MTDPARPIVAATAATLLHLALLAWLLPGFGLWGNSGGAPGRSVSMSGDTEFDLPFVPVTLPSGPLALEWSLGSIQAVAPSQPAPRFERPEGMRPGRLAMSQLGDAATEAGQAAVRTAVSQDLETLTALADAPAEFVADISLAGAQLRLAPLMGALALRESGVLSHQVSGRDAEVASAPRPRSTTQPATAPIDPTTAPEARRRPSMTATSAAAPETIPPQPAATPEPTRLPDPATPTPTAARAAAPTAIPTVSPRVSPTALATSRATPTATTAPSSTVLPTATPSPLSVPDPTGRIIPQIYAPATAPPEPTPWPLPDLAPPQPPRQPSLAPPDFGRLPSVGNAPDQGGGVYTPNSNVFFSRMTAHLFAANQRALASAIRAGPKLTLDVRFWIDRDGHVIAARVARTSGIPELDRRAEQVLLDASPVPRLAPDMPQETLELSFPVEVYR